MGARTVRSRPGRLGAVIGAVLALVAMIGLPRPALAWGEYGHRTIAAIALANVSPRSRAEIARLLRHAREIGTPDCSLRTLGDASVWPDCVRRDGWRWGYTAPWHYQTEPVCEDYDVRKNCANGNCVSAQIERNLRLLADESLPGNVRLEALAFLVHFTGDIHMPLHSGDDNDRGGNDRKAAYGIAPGLNLHWIWDGPLAERAISSAVPPLVRRYSAQERAALATGTVADWGRESWALGRTVVYPGAFGRDPCAGDLPGETVLSQDAIVAALPAVRQRIEQAGLRLARQLDQAFAPGALPAPPR